MFDEYAFDSFDSYDDVMEDVEYSDYEDLLGYDPDEADAYYDELAGLEDELEEFDEVA